eukprot:3339245-Rhodomonas_salina.1
MAKGANADAMDERVEDLVSQLSREIKDNSLWSPYKLRSFPFDFAVSALCLCWGMPVLRLGWGADRSIEGRMGAIMLCTMLLWAATGAR